MKTVFIAILLAFAFATHNLLDLQDTMDDFPFKTTFAETEEGEPINDKWVEYSEVLDLWAKKYSDVNQILFYRQGDYCIIVCKEEDCKTNKTYIRLENGWENVDNYQGAAQFCEEEMFGVLTEGEFRDGQLYAPGTPAPVSDETVTDDSSSNEGSASGETSNEGSASGETSNEGSASGETSNEGSTTTDSGSTTTDSGSTDSGSSSSDSGSSSSDSGSSSSGSGSSTASDVSATSTATNLKAFISWALTQQNDVDSMDFDGNTMYQYCKGLDNCEVQSVVANDCTKLKDECQEIQTTAEYLDKLCDFLSALDANNNDEALVAISTHGGTEGRDPNQGHFVVVAQSQYMKDEQLTHTLETCTPTGVKIWMLIDACYSSGMANLYEFKERTDKHFAFFAAANDEVVGWGAQNRGGFLTNCFTENVKPGMLTWKIADTIQTCIENTRTTVENQRSGTYFALETKTTRPQDLMMPFGYK